MLATQTEGITDSSSVTDQESVFMVQGRILHRHYGDGEGCGLFESPCLGLSPDQPSPTT